MSRRRTTVRQYSVEEQALTDISESKEAENCLAAKRAARAEAREIRTKEIERQQREAEEKERLGNDYGAARSRQQSSTASSRRGSNESSENDSTSSKDRSLKMEMRTLEEKYKAAMITSAQVENERQSLVYQVELLKDQLEELTESFTELQREYKEKNTNLELTKRELNASQLEAKALRDQNDYKDRLITESGFVIVAAENGDLALERSSEPPSSNGPVGTGGLLLSSESLVLLNKGREGSLGMHSLASSPSATHTPQSASSTDPSQPPSLTRAEEPQSQSPVLAESDVSVTGQSSEGSSVDGPMIQTLPQTIENRADSSPREADKAETGVCVEAVDNLSGRSGNAASHAPDGSEVKTYAQEADLVSSNVVESVTDQGTSHEGTGSESHEESAPDAMQTLSHGEDEGGKLSGGAVGLEQNSVVSHSEDRTDSSPEGPQSQTGTTSDSQDRQSNIPSIVLTQCSHSQRVDSRDSEDDDVEFFDAVSTPVPSNKDAVFSEFVDKEGSDVDQVAGRVSSESGEHDAGEDDKEYAKHANEDDKSDAGEVRNDTTKEDDEKALGEEGQEIVKECDANNEGDYRIEDVKEDDENDAGKDSKEAVEEVDENVSWEDCKEIGEEEDENVAGEDDKEIKGGGDVGATKESAKKVGGEYSKEEEGGEVAEATEKDSKRMDKEDDRDIDGGDDKQEIVTEGSEVSSIEKSLEMGVERKGGDIGEIEGKIEGQEVECKDQGSSAEVLEVNKENQLDTGDSTVYEIDQKPSGSSGDNDDENEYENDDSCDEHPENNTETDGRIFVSAKSDAEACEMLEKVDTDHDVSVEEREEQVSVRVVKDVSVGECEARETLTGSDDNAVQQSQIPCTEVRAYSEESSVAQGSEEPEKRPESEVHTHADESGFTCTEKIGKNVEPPLPVGTDEKENVEPSLPVSTDEKENVEPSLPVSTNEKENVEPSLPVSTDEKENVEPSLPDSTDSQTASASLVEVHQASSSPADDEVEDIQKSSQGEREVEEESGVPASDGIQKRSSREVEMDQSGPSDSQGAELGMEDGEDSDVKSKEKGCDQSQKESTPSEDNSRIDAEGGVEEEKESRHENEEEHVNEESEEVPDTLSPLLDSRKPVNRELGEGGTSEDSSAQLNDDEYDFDDIDAVLDHDSPVAEKGKDTEPSSICDSDDTVSFGSKDSGLQDSVAKDDAVSHGSRDSGLQESAPSKESETENRDTVSMQSGDSGAGIEDLPSPQSEDSSHDDKVKALAAEKKKLAEEVKRLENLLDDEQSKQRKAEVAQLPQVNGPEMQLYEVQREASKQIHDYKFKLQKAEQDIATLEGMVGRQETQLKRYKSEAERAEGAEDELKQEKRKLQRELREAQTQVEELQNQNKHLTLRLDRIKQSRTALGIQ